jgi:hypothetical protein
LYGLSNAGDKTSLPLERFSFSSNQNYASYTYSSDHQNHSSGKNLDNINNNNKNFDNSRYNLNLRNGSAILPNIVRASTVEVIEDPSNHVSNINRLSQSLLVPLSIPAGFHSETILVSPKSNINVAGKSYSPNNEENNKDVEYDVSHPNSPSENDNVLEYIKSFMEDSSKGIDNIDAHEGIVTTPNDSVEDKKINDESGESIQKTVKNDVDVNFSNTVVDDDVTINNEVGIQENTSGQLNGVALSSAGSSASLPFSETVSTKYSSFSRTKARDFFSTLPFGQHMRKRVFFFFFFFFIFL